MPPLDTGSPTHTLRLVDPLNTRAEPATGDFQTIGAYLRAVREHHGRSLADLAADTRIGRVYLAAIEGADYSALPSRPFAIGYVRAYAAALGLDGDTIAELYKREAPAGDEGLRAPVGVGHEQTGRRPLFVAIAAIVVAAVVGWNIVQRVLSDSQPPPESPVPSAQAEAPAVAPQGPISLGAPTPPPAEQTTPAPYLPPGLTLQAAPPEGEVVAEGAAIPIPAPAPAPAPKTASVVASAPPEPVFSTRGVVYGVDGSAPTIVLQARKPSSLIVRGPGGEVYFARQLATGEAYRAPIGQKLSAEVTDPAAFSVYINGQLRGVLTVEQTPLDRVVSEIAAQSPAP